MVDWSKEDIKQAIEEQSNIITKFALLIIIKQVIDIVMEEKKGKE